MVFQFAGLQFHLYGLLLGIAASGGVLLGEKVIERYPEEKSSYWLMVSAVFFGGIVGARLYHVWTDWARYANHLDQVWQVWNGGLSIIGAGIGGCVAIAIVISFRKTDKKSWWGELFFWTDLTVLCLPISQAIGRLGNFVNQELYGLPTSLPWAIFIDQAHRVKGYEQVSYFHPLFAYEALGMLLCASLLWWLKRKQGWQLGMGKLTLFYFAFYGLFRGGLEFLRIDKANLSGSTLGINQVILFGVGALSAFTLVAQVRKPKRQLSAALPLLLVTLFTGLLLTGCQPKSSTTPVLPSPRAMTDRSQQQIILRRQAVAEALPLTVEVVRSAESVRQGLSDRDQIGSDGMLFIFPRAEMQVFWMYHMKFDLDLIWLRDKKVTGISENVPHPFSPNQDSSTLPRFQSPTTVDMVLEVPAGTAKSWQLRVGDALELP